MNVTRVWNELVDMQQGEGDKKNTDVHLICADGLVPAHTAILGQLSPVLRDAFISQVSKIMQCSVYRFINVECWCWTYAYVYLEWEWPIFNLKF